MNASQSAAGTHARPTFDKVPDSATQGQKNDLNRLKSLCKDYESYFMKEVLSAMRKTVPQDGYLNGGNAEEIYKSMMDDQLSKNMANNSNSGIAQELYNRLSKTYLAANSPKPQGEQK